MSKAVVATRCEGLIEADVDGEMVALHVDSGTCYGFNGTATRIWALLEQPKTLGQLCDSLGTEFEVDEATCETEVLALLQELAADGLVQLTGDNSPAGS